MDRIFLPAGKLEDDLVDAWMSTADKGVYQHVLCGDLDPTTKLGAAMPLAAASLLTEPGLPSASQ